MENNKNETKKGVIILSIIDKKDFEKGLIVIIHNENNELVRGAIAGSTVDNQLIVVYKHRKYNVDYDKVFKFELADVTTKKHYPIVRSQWYDIIVNKLKFEIRPYYVNEYSYENNKSEIRAKIIFDEKDEVSKPKVTFTINKRLIITIIDGLENKDEQKRLLIADELRDLYSIKGDTHAEVKLIE